MQCFEKSWNKWSKTSSNRKGHSVETNIKNRSVACILNPSSCCSGSIKVIQDSEGVPKFAPSKKKPTTTGSILVHSIVCHPEFLKKQWSVERRWAAAYKALRVQLVLHAPALTPEPPCNESCSLGEPLCPQLLCCSHSNFLGHFHAWIKVFCPSQPAELQGIHS